MSIEQDFRKSVAMTGDNLRTIAQALSDQQLSQLSLPEVDAVVEQIARVIPAGNVPGVILNGLARLAGHRPPAQEVRRDINLIFKGVEQSLDKAVYGAFFAGPAAVIWGYQNLLKLAGRSPDDAFPNGTWQFYLEYALREDTARHTNETHGFDTLLREHNAQLDLVDRMTAWVMTTIYCLYQYDELLRNEWRERTYTYLLKEVVQGTPYEAALVKVYGEWEAQRPYARGTDVTATDDYPTYRRIKFDRFIQDNVNNLPPELQQEWSARIRLAKDEDMPQFQNQLSILAYLEPGAYGETRVAMPIEQTHIGVIYQGHYYLIPVYMEGRLNDVGIVRQMMASLVQSPATDSASPLAPLARLQRKSWVSLRNNLPDSFLQELNLLRTAPILLNFDAQSDELPLAEIRQGERGIGDHALTIFDTGNTFVFDQSHIFFDGAWGAALAEILTNEALSWAAYLSNLPPATPGTSLSYALQLQPIDEGLLTQLSPAATEVSAETTSVKVGPILSLRKIFRQRSDLIQLTVNDLLVLYRAIHASTYQPDAELVDELQSLDHPAADHALKALRDRSNPSIIIPVDASQRSPRDRLYPMCFEVPIYDLDLLNLHQRVIDSLDEYDLASGSRTEAYARFDEAQRLYLATLAGFGQILSRAKEIANSGEAASAGAIKLLANMPTPLQRLLDQIPGRFDVINDLIKGREVMSNVGAVAKSSTLRRFITAKDDNEKKTLCWGIITDANRAMVITLRDFRPHVGELINAGYKDLAGWILTDYLEAYARGMNQYISDLQHITQASRETRFLKGSLDGE